MRFAFHYGAGKLGTLHDYLGGIYNVLVGRIVVGLANIDMYKFKSGIDATFGSVSASITDLGNNQFRANVPTSGGASFFRVHRL